MGLKAKTSFVKIAVILLAGLPAAFAHASDSMPVQHLKKDVVGIERKDLFVMLKMGGKIICKIEPVDKPVWLDNPIRISTDNKAVILSPLEYVFFSDIEACSGGAIKPRSVGRNHAALIDINAAAKIYLSVDIVSSSPFQYIADFGRLDGRLMDFHPKGVKTGSLALDQRRSFSDVDDINPKGRISPDGRYVSAADVPHCSIYAYPGVWDLLKKRAVVFSGGSDEENEQRCASLFVGP